MSDDVELVAELVQGTSDLKLELTLRNHGGAAIYAFWTPHLDYDAEDALYPLDPFGYGLEIAGDVAVLAKKIMAVPPLTFVETRNVPFVVRVEAATQISESLVVPLPARERGPYLDLDDPVPPDDTVIRTLNLVAEVGFFLVKPGTDALAQSFKTNKGPARGFAPFPIGSQSLVRTGTLAQIPVIYDARLPGGR